MKDKKRNIKDKVGDISVRTFTICGCPESVFNRFVQFCKTNARNTKYYKDNNGKLHVKKEDVYHFGLRLLLDIAETDAKTVTLYEKIHALDQRIALVEKRLEGKKKTKRKTFGG